jgi:hypothetical protein
VCACKRDLRRWTRSRTYENEELNCDPSKVSQSTYKCTFTLPKFITERFSHVLAKEQLSLEIEGVPEATAQMVLNALLPFIQSNPDYNRRTGGREFPKWISRFCTDAQQHHKYRDCFRSKSRKRRRSRRQMLRKSLPLSLC